MGTKTLLTIGEKIDRAKDGRTQKWIVAQMNNKGVKITEVQFSNKKNAGNFNEKELQVLSEILNADLIL